MQELAGDPKRPRRTQRTHLHSQVPLLPPPQLHLPPGPFATPELLPLILLCFAVQALEPAPVLVCVLLARRVLLPLPLALQE